MERLCGGEECQHICLPKKHTILVAYMASALAIAAPLVNSMGATVKSTLAFTNLNFSFLTLFLIGVWLLSGFVGGQERHQSYLQCVIHSLGIPGIILLILTMAQA